MAEENSLTGRVRRYAQVTGAVGGLAAKLAGQRFLGLDLNPTTHAAELTAALGGIKGPLMKLAQLAATIPDALPKEYAAELAQLQANAPPMGWPFVKRRMVAELGAGWAGRFAEFSRDAVAAASLGQVHKATLADGSVLAVKLQYPDMGSAVEADLNQLRLVLGIYERADRTIGTDAIRTEIAARLREELDYRREARHMALYAAMLAGEDGVRVPTPYPDLSTDRLLSMSWLDGRPLREYFDAPQDQRNRLALNLFRAWYVPFYFYGVIHGDPHPGNYAVAAEDRLNLLDFGCIRIFPPRFVAGVIDLYHALQNQDDALAVHAYEQWGFRNLSRELIAILNRWAGFLYGPLLEDRVRKISDVPAGQFGREVAESVHADLRRLGGITPPREFVFMDRAAIGLGSMFTHLRAEINWHRLFHELIADFDATKLADRQMAALAAAEVPTAL